MRPGRRTIGAAVAALALATVGAAGSGSMAAAAPRSDVEPRPSAGCGRAGDPDTGSTTVATTSGGTPRTYLRHLPPAYDGATPLPLVIDLHGYLESAPLHEANTMLGAYGDDHGFVTVTPEGLGPPPHWDVEPDAPDVRFLRDLLDETADTLCIDRRRVFVTGYSNGAFLASTLACVEADRIAAIAPVAGLVDPPRCKPERPVPVLTFHGTADDFVDYEGGLGAQAQVTPADDGTGRMLGETSGGRGGRPASTPKVVAAWAKRDSCSAKTATAKVADDVIRIAHRCPRGVAVVLYRIEGGGHTWPGSEFSKAIEAVLGPTTLSIDADELIWDFFRAHPLTRG